MTNQQSAFHVRMFVSYSHKDTGYRDTMENALALLLQYDGFQKWV